MSGRRKIWLVAGYMGVLLAAIVPIFAVRPAVIAAFSDASEQRHWQAWKKTTVESTDKASPVQRRPVRVDEPPALLLFRDHFHAIVLVASVIVTFAYYFIAMLWHSRRAK